MLAANKCWAIKLWGTRSIRAKAADAGETAPLDKSEQKNEKESRYGGDKIRGLEEELEEGYICEAEER